MRRFGTCISLALSSLCVSLLAAGAAVTCSLWDPTSCCSSSSGKSTFVFGSLKDVSGVFMMFARVPLSGLLRAVS